MSKTSTSKAQTVRTNNETVVAKLAKRLRKGTKAAVKDLQAIIVQAGVLDITHKTLTRIQNAFIAGDPAGMADAIEATYTGKADRQGRVGESSNLAWLMYLIDSHDYTPEKRNAGRVMTREAFRNMKVDKGGHIPLGMSLKEAIAEGFLTPEGEPITDGVTPEPMADAEMTPIHMTQAQLGDFKAFLEAQKNA